METIPNEHSNKDFELTKQVCQQTSEYEEICDKFDLFLEIVGHSMSETRHQEVNHGRYMILLTVLPRMGWTCE